MRIIATETTRAAVAALAMLLTAAAAHAQFGESAGPFTPEEAERMRDVWPEIRQAEEFGDIDWEAVGLDVAPGDAEARRLMARHWDALRSAERFSEIDWERTTDYRPTRADRFERRDRFSQDDGAFGPFTREEAEQLSAVWPEIREAESFQEIDWEAVGLGVAPGDAEARRLMTAHWETLRSAERFRDIDWEETTDYRASSRFERRDRFGRDETSRQDRESTSLGSGPFTAEEAEQLSAVWPEIRRAERFEEIDWDAVGLGVAPGDAEARRLMANHWDALRQAERFSDINWEATTGNRFR